MDPRKILRIQKKAKRLKRKPYPLTYAEIKWLLDTAILLVDDLNVQLEEVTRKCEEEHPWM
jgi:hypothetical protein